MELLDIIQHLYDFYIQKFGQPPHEITLGEYWYDKAREDRIVETREAWRDHRGYILGVKLDVCRRDPFKIAIEGFRPVEKMQHRFELRD